MSDKALTEKIEALEASTTALLEQNKAQADRIQQLEKSQGGNSLTISDPVEEVKIEIPEKAFSVKGKKYRFKVAKFRIKTASHLASDAMEDKALLAMIVEKYPGLVEQVKA